MTRSHLTSQRAVLATHERRDTQLAPHRVLAVLLALALMQATSVFAAGVVGTGTPDSCTEAALDAALVGGGNVTFNCGSAPATITITSTTLIAADTTIDGGSLITISGGNRFELLLVHPPITFTVENLTVANVTGIAISNGDAYSDGGTVNLRNSTFSGNRGIFNRGILTVDNSTFSGNGTTNGGAIYNAGGTVTVTNSTFSGNTATGDGGAIWNGAVFNPAILTVTNSTFSANTAANGGAIWNGDTLTVTNTIFAKKIGDIHGHCAGDTITDGGHNLEDGMSCGFSMANGSLSNTDPKLDPAGLANNGGPTQTIALLAGSPAINAGDPEVCANPPIYGIDQRGHMRPGEGSVNCSIGAYEYNSLVVVTPPPTVTPPSTATPTQTRTATPIPTASPTPTRTATPIPSASPIPTRTATPIPSATPIPTVPPSGDDGGGCTVAPDRSSGAAWWLLVPALLLASARRRKRG